MVRFKNRYIAIEVNPLSENMKKKPFQLKDYMLRGTVLDAVEALHGDFGVAAMVNGFASKYCSETTRIAVLRVRHGPHRLLASSLPFVMKIDDTPITLRTLFTTATLKRCLLLLKKRQITALDDLWAWYKTDDDHNALEKIFVDVSAKEDRLLPEYAAKKFVKKL